MNIIVYTKTGCPWCKGVLDLLHEKKIDFEERNVTTNKAFFDEMVRISGQTKAPTLDIDGEILADSDRDQVGEFLRIEGVAA
jgi:glutaredoxin